MIDDNSAAAAVVPNIVELSLTFVAGILSAEGGGHGSGGDGGGDDNGGGVGSGGVGSGGGGGGNGARHK